MRSKFLVLQNKDQFSCISGIRFGTVSVTNFLSPFPVSDSLIHQKKMKMIKTNFLKKDTKKLYVNIK